MAATTTRINNNNNNPNNNNNNNNATIITTISSRCSRIVLPKPRMLILALAASLLAFLVNNNDSGVDATTTAIFQRRRRRPSSSSLLRIIPNSLARKETTTTTTVATTTTTPTIDYHRNAGAFQFVPPSSIIASFSFQRRISSRCCNRGRSSIHRFNAQIMTPSRRRQSRVVGSTRFGIMMMANHNNNDYNNDNNNDNQDDEFNPTKLEEITTTTSKSKSKSTATKTKITPPKTIIIANQKFTPPTPSHLRTISSHQLFHPLSAHDHQTFSLSSNLCRHGHPQALGMHPTRGPKLNSGLFRLTCPLLVEAIDEWEGEGGVRELSDWMRMGVGSGGGSGSSTGGGGSSTGGGGTNWKIEGYQRANEMQKLIRMELVDDDADDASDASGIGDADIGDTSTTVAAVAGGGGGRQRLISRLGEYNAQKFLESGVAGIPPDQTFQVKCIHAHVADHLCRCPSNDDGGNNDGVGVGVIGVTMSDKDVANNINNGGYFQGNIIGNHALNILQHQRGVAILGNDVCWKQCSGCSATSSNSHDHGDDDVDSMQYDNNDRKAVATTTSGNSTGGADVDYFYVPKKNRQGLRSTRLRRKELREGGNAGNKIEKK